MNTKCGQVVTAGGTSATDLVVTDKPFQSQTLTFFIKVLTGTVKFGIGGVDAAAYGYTSADGNIIFECGRHELFFQAASGADTFVVV